MRTISADGLKLILESHKKWLIGDNGDNGEKADLHGANLSEADLRGAYLRGADLSEADLRGAVLSWADLHGADLRGAVLSWADLHGANLSEADLRGACLRWAYLRGADLSEADLSKADLRLAVLSGATGPFLQFSFERHTAIAIKTHIYIGCERRTIEDWILHYEAIGARNGYTEQQIKAYGQFIKMAADWAKEGDGL